MAFYSVHKREDAPAEQAVFVREGFSTSAFLFTVLWALWHRMWLAAGVLLAVSGAITLAGNLLGAGEGVSLLASFVVNLIFGLEARDLQIRTLIGRGYAQVGFSHGRNLDEAEIRYFHRIGGYRTVPEPLPTRPVPYAAQPDTLGIFGNV
ncbi:MAG: DUF2628 domain-containing protein [Rhizobiales bacterium]|nr:DUF2628 domain-containing protein [Hyphomicrobiales bacterium]